MRKYPVLKILASFSLFISLGFVSLSAQIIPISHILPDGVQGQNYGGKVDFDVVGVDQNLVTWNWTAVVGGATLSHDQIISNLGLTLETSIGEVTGTITAGLTSASVIPFTVSASVMGGTNPPAKTYNMIIRSSAPNDCGEYKFSLVLDASGSMNAGTGGLSRWEELKDAVRTYLPSLNNWTDGGSDELQVVYFQGAGASEQFNDDFDAIDWRDVGDIDAQIFGTKSPGGGTPLGAGVDAAVLPSSFEKRAIILFTDGHQNGSNLYDHPTTRTSGTELPTNVSDTDFLNVFSIGVGGCDETLINNIGRPTGGSASAFTYNPGELDVLFQTTIPELFNNCSPRIVDFRTGTIPAIDDKIRHKFHLNNFVDKLSVILKLKTGDSQIEDDIRLFSENIPFVPTEFFSSNEVRYFIDLPYTDETTGNNAIDGGGEWTLEFSGTVGAEYDLMIMVDDKYFNSELSVGNNGNVFAGDPIEVEATADFVGEPLDDLNLKAILLRPGEDPGRLFSETSFAPSGSLPETDVLTGQSISSLQAQAKINGLLADPSFLAQLQNEERIRPLISQGNGRYTTTFPPADTEVSSYYKLVVAYNGSVPGLDSINGLEIDHLMVQFSRPQEIDLNQSIVFVNNADLTGYNVSIRPTNKFGNPIGPAKAQNMRVLFDNKPVILEDQLNGTYTGFYSTAVGDQPKVEIYVNDFDRPVYTTIPGGASFGISAHAGVLSNLSSPTPLDTLSSGFYIEGDITVRLSPNWELEAIVGNNQFDDNFSVLEVGLYGSYLFNQQSIAGFTPSLKAGLGYFKPSPLEGTMGVGLRGGLSKPLGGQLEGGFEFGASYLLKHEMLLGKVGAFVKYYF